MFSSPTPELWPAPLRPIAALGGLTLDLVSALGRFGRFFGQAVGYVVIPPFKIVRLIDRIHFIGFRSLTIVILTGAFTGMVLGLQIFLTLSRFGSEAYLGPAVALSLIRELGPVLCAVFVTGLAGSALTAEIGIMKITEQIDALQVMALNPMRYLVSPALVAGVITFPLLTAIFDVVGILGGYLVGVELLGLSSGTYFGEIMVVIGRSGGGKSVLLKHLIGLLRPDAGTVAVDGVEITRLRGGELDRVRERYGVVFQGGALFDSMSVAENVAFPLREKSRLRHAEIRERVEEKLEQVGLSDMGHKNPAEISGGMRKRVAIARALVTEPEIVFFDEPTTGLDPILVNTIHHLIMELHRKFRFTAVMVSHEIPEIFEIADRVAMLHDGVIVEVGPPDAVRASANPIVQQFIRGDIETVPAGQRR